MLTAESGLVVVPLHVYKNRKSVGGLGEQAFELVEDGVVQEIAFVDGPSGPEDPARGRVIPIEIILLVDVGNTMRVDLLDTRKLRESFFEGVRDNVAISVYGFTDRLKRFTEPTRDLAKVQIALEMAYSSGDGQIPILDAIIATARDAATRPRNAAKKLVVLSGGLNRGIFGSAAHSALDFEIPVYDVVVRRQKPIVMGGSTNVFSYWATPVLLGRPDSRDQAAPQGRPDSRHRKQRSVPPHKCCPLGIESSREHKLMRIDAWERTNNHLLGSTDHKSILVRAYLNALAKMAQNEYFVGYYPSRKGDEPVARQAEVRLKNKRIGQLYGGRRVIVY